MVLDHILHNFIGQMNVMNVTACVQLWFSGDKDEDIPSSSIMNKVSTSTSTLVIWVKVSEA